LKGQRAESLRGSGYDDMDLGAHHLNSGAHSSDFNIPLPVALAPGQARIAADSLNTNGVTFELWNCATRAYVSAFKAQRHLPYARTKHPTMIASPRHYSFINAVLTFFHRTLITNEQNNRSTTFDRLGPSQTNTYSSLRSSRLRRKAASPLATEADSVGDSGRLRDLPPGMEPVVMLILRSSQPWKSSRG
jgi:hypothetical protein